MTRWLAVVAAMIVTAALATGLLLGPGRDVLLPSIPQQEGVEAVRLTTDGSLPELPPYAAVCGDSLEEPRLSPDGRLAASVVSVIDRGRRFEAVQVWPTGSPPTPRAPENDNRTLCWSPNGERLAFLHRDGNQEDLVVTGAGGAPLARIALSDYRGVKSAYAGFFVLSWSPGSDQIAVIWRHHRPGEALLWRLYLANADGSSLHLAAEQEGTFVTFLGSPWGDDEDIVSLFVDRNLWAVALTEEALDKLRRYPMRENSIHVPRSELSGKASELPKQTSRGTGRFGGQLERPINGIAC